MGCTHRTGDPGRWPAGDCVAPVSEAQPLRGKHDIIVRDVWVPEYRRARQTRTSCRPREKKSCSSGGGGGGGDGRGSRGRRRGGEPGRGGVADVYPAEQAAEAASPIEDGGVGARATGSSP